MDELVFGWRSLFPSFSNNNRLYTFGFGRLLPCCLNSVHWIIMKLMMVGSTTESIHLTIILLPQLDDAMNKIGNLFNKIIIVISTESTMYCNWLLLVLVWWIKTCWIKKYIIISQQYNNSNYTPTNMRMYKWVINNQAHHVSAMIFVTYCASRHFNEDSFLWYFFNTPKKKSHSSPKTNPNCHSLNSNNFKSS